MGLEVAELSNVSSGTALCLLNRLSDTKIWLRFDTSAGQKTPLGGGTRFFAETVRRGGIRSFQPDSHEGNSSMMLTSAAPESLTMVHPGDDRDVWKGQRRDEHEVKAEQRVRIGTRAWDYKK